MAKIINKRYQLEETLGRGGMGTVYRAYDRLTGQYLALKRVTAAPSSLEIATRIAPDASLSMALANEFRTLASLRHPNIISVLDYGFEIDMQPFFTMRLLEQATPIDIYARNIQPSEKIGLLVQILQALNYLHRRGILHRDLKPSNVLATANQIYLLDFGLALDASYAHTRGNAAGTLAYLAPEVLLGAMPSVLSDLYAFGVLAYEILIGEHPFPSKTNSELVHKIIMEAVVVDESRLDDSLSAVVMRLLSKLPDDRYSSSLDALRTLCEAADYPLPPETEEIRESFLVAANFVGREAELATLNDSLEQITTGVGQAWLIGGESGVGKSRLMEELRAKALVRGTMALRGQAVSEGGLPYQVWREMLRHLLLTVDVSDEEAYLLKNLVPDIEILLGREIRDLAYDSITIQKRLPLLILSLLTDAAAQRPLVMFLEDLQWAAESLDILVQIVAGIAAHPILIVANYRSDESPNLKEKLSAMQYMELSRLSAKSIRELSQAMLGEIGVQENVLELIQRESEGNAFFIVEVVRALAEEAGQLGDIGRSTLPAQVFAGGVKRIVERRLAHLPDWAIYPLKVAAIAGRQINMSLMKVILPNLDLDAWLDKAGEAAVFTVSGDTWQFAHDKLREYVSGNLEKEERRKIHLEVAHGLEESYSENLDDYAVLLMQHFGAGGNEQKEAHYALIAAEVNIELNAQDARRYVQRAMALNAHQSHENPQKQLAALYRLLGRACMRMNDYPAARSALESSRQICELIGDSIGIAIVKQLLGELGFLTAQFKEAIPMLEESLAVLLPTEDWRNIGYSYMNLGVIMARQNQLEIARDYFLKCLDAMEKTGDIVIIAQAQNNLGISYDMAGELDKAEEIHKRSLELRRKAKDKRGIAYSLNNLASLAFDQNHFEDAKILRLEALRIVKEIGDKRAESTLNDALGNSEAKDGNYTLALSYFEQALSIAKAIDDGFLIPSILWHIGETEEKLGRDGSDAFYEALANSLNYDILPRKLECLETIAEWGKSKGDFALALKIYAVLNQNSAVYKQDKVEPTLKDLAAMFSPEEYAKAFPENPVEIDAFANQILKERGKQSE